VLLVIEHAPGDQQKKTANKSGGSWRTFALLPHRAEAHNHRALQVGWSRFRAVLMLTAFYL